MNSRAKEYHLFHKQKISFATIEKEASVIFRPFIFESRKRCLDVGYYKMNNV